MKLFKRALFVGLLSVSVAMLSLPTQAQPIVPTQWHKPPQLQTIVVHLSNFTGDLHAAMMAIKFAGTLQRAGAKVILFLDLEGVRAGDMRQPQNLSWGFQKGPTFAKLYRDFVKAKGQVVLSPHCAKAAGIIPKDLRPGAVVGTTDSITNFLLLADKVIDY